MLSPFALATNSLSTQLSLSAVACGASFNQDHCSHKKKGNKERRNRSTLTADAGEFWPVTVLTRLTRTAMPCMQLCSSMTAQQAPLASCCGRFVIPYEVYGTFEGCTCFVVPCVLSDRGSVVCWLPAGSTERLRTRPASRTVPSTKT